MKTNAERQAAWRQRRKQKGEPLLLIQAHLEEDIVRGLDAYAATHSTNRVQIIRTLIVNLLTQAEIEFPHAKP